MERHHILKATPEFSNFKTEICGFGPISSSALSTKFIHEHSPKRVVLVGIAGAYRQQSNHLQLKQAYTFQDVASYGIGAGSGDDFKTPGDMGLAQYVASNGDEVSDEIALVDPGSQSRRQLLTVCAAAANAKEVEQRLSVKSHAMAEDMEGFSVALACRIHGVKLTIVRGISNWAGDRDVKNWQIEPALESAAKMVMGLIDA